MTDPDGLHRRSEREAGIKEDSSIQAPVAGWGCSCSLRGRTCLGSQKSRVPLARVELEILVGELSRPIKQVFTEVIWSSGEDWAREKMV